MTISRVTFSGQSLTTLDDQGLLQLLLRDDLPPYLTALYGNEADQRMGKFTPVFCVPAPREDQAVTI